MKQKLVMQKLLSSITEGHHHNQQQFHSCQNDPCQHLRQQTTQHRVIPTKLHHQKDQQPNNDTQYIDTNNYFIPDGSDRHIHDIPNKVFHAGYLENGNNAYLLHLPKLQDMLHTSQFLMDETSGQFYAVYGNTYQRMSTKPMLKKKWDQGELIDQLAATRQEFGYAR